MCDWIVDVCQVWKNLQEMITTPSPLNNLEHNSKNKILVVLVVISDMKLIWLMSSLCILMMIWGHKFNRHSMCEVWISLPSTRRFEGMMLRCSFEKSINSLGSLSCHYLKNSGDPHSPHPSLQLWLLPTLTVWFTLHCSDLHGLSWKHSTGLFLVTGVVLDT